MFWRNVIIDTRHMSYLFLLIVLFILTFYLERKFKIHLFSSKRERFLIPLIFFVIGVIWDTYAVYQGHWFFRKENLNGLYIGVLPLEEYVFFLVFPYAVITIYKVLRIKIK